MIQKYFVILAAAMLLSAAPCAADEINPVIGRAGDHIIRESDVDRILSNQPPAVQKRFMDEPRQKSALVKEILTKKLIVDQARKENFDRKPDVKEQLAYAIENFLAQEYLARVVASGISISDEELKKAYQENEKEFLLPEQVKVRHILIAVEKTAPLEERQKSRVRAEALLLRIKAGEDFSKLAIENSDDQNSAAGGGELTPFSAGRTNAAEFEKAAFSLKSGETSEVVESPYGYHIIRMIERREKRTAPFGDVRDLIYEQLKAERERQKVQQYVEKIIKGSGMKISGEEPVTLPESGSLKPADGEIKPAR